MLKYLLIFLLISCGEDFSGGKRFEDPVQAEQTVAVAPQSFSTRLNSTLQVSGEKCRGDETTEAFGRGERCEAGQYLVKLDNVNTCDSNGRCSSFVVIPVIVELKKFNSDLSVFTFFEPVPISAMTDAQANILDRLLIRADVNGNAQVLFRDPALRN